MTPFLAQRPRADRSFERLYRRHVGDVYRYALVVLRNPEDAEDVTQTAFLNAYRAYQRGERPHSPRNWLIAIAHNVCRQRFRQSARRPQEVDLDVDQAVEVIPDEDAPTAEEIRGALDNLAFNQRAALVMRELEGRSYVEIAEVLGLSTSAVETLIFRARRALREQLDGALTCDEAERAISRQLDGRLSRSEKGALRAHLRQCKECARVARSLRAQRSAWKALAAIPLPTSLESFFGPGGVAAANAVGGAVGGAGVGFAVKAATVAAVGVAAAGAGYTAVKADAERPAPPPAQAPVERSAPKLPAAAERARVDVPRALGPRAAVSRGRSATAPRGKALAHGKAKRAHPDKPVGRALGHSKKAKVPKTEETAPRNETAPNRRRVVPATTRARPVTHARRNGRPFRTVPKLKPKPPPPRNERSVGPKLKAESPPPPVLPQAPPPKPKDK